MTQTRNTQSGPNARDEAIAWHVLLEGGDATGEDWERFSQWLSSDPSHNAAFQEIEALWAELDAAKDEILPQLSLAGAVTGTGPERRNFVGGMTARHARYALAALAASLVLFVGIWSVWFTDPGVGHYATRLGERREVTLADGSHIYLNANTQMTVELNAAERRVVLERGEALFDVAKDPGRPFWVAAASQRIRVVGTMFNILKGADTVTVTVARGIVDVMPAAEANSDTPTKQRQIARLIAGQQLIQQDGNAVPKITDIDPDRVIAWRDGHLIYDDAPLSQVADDLNRYFPVRIEPQDDRVGALRFSGVLQLDTEDGVVERLKALLPIETKRVDDVISIRLNTPED